MAEYISAETLLADVRLRLDGLGSKAAALVVEGYDDKRLFYHRVNVEAEVIPSGGKRLLRAGLEAIRDSDKGRILFLTDCDYDVLNGTLHGGPDVVITNACDVEADLMALNVLEKVVVEVVPGVVSAKGNNAKKIAVMVQRDAEMMARILGRIRIAAQPLGVDLDLAHVNLVKYWDKNNNGPLVEKIQIEMLNRLRKGGVDISKSDWLALIAATPDRISICNGKDLIAAARMILCLRYRMDHKVTNETLTIMVRLAVEEQQFEKWPVVQRIRQWEMRNGRSLLKEVA